jgi:hypothetical protein
MDRKDVSAAEIDTRWDFEILECHRPKRQYYTRHLVPQTPTLNAVDELMVRS